MDLQPTCPRDEWVERLAVRFRELQPRISHEQAGDVASAAFPTAGDLEPEEAAVVFGEIMDAHVPLDDLLATLRAKESPRQVGSESEGSA